MIRNREVIEKGAYVHYQPGAFLQVKNFIIANKSGKRCLLLQLVNTSDITVDGFKLALIQLDSIGNVISKDTFAYGSVKIAAAATYSVDVGLVLKPECADFRVQMVYALSGEYKYVFKNGQTVQHYDPRGYRGTRAFSHDAGTLNVRRRFETGKVLIGLIAAVAFFGVSLALAYAAIGALI